MATAEERELMKELRTRLQDSDLSGLEDHILWAHLIANKYDLSDAEKFLIQFVDFRTKLMGERIISFADFVPLPELVKALPIKFLGTNEAGQPIMWNYPGKLNAREIFSKGLKYDFYKYMVKMVDDACKIVYEHSCRAGKLIRGICLADFKDISITKFLHTDMLGFMQQSKGFEQISFIYETMYVLNCSWGYYYVFKIIKPMIPKDVVAMMEVLDTNVKTWKGVLSKNCSMNLIPSEYGGSGMKVYA